MLKNRYQFCLLISVLLLTSMPTYAETLAQVCHGYRQSSKEIIESDEDKNEFANGLLWKVKTLTGRTNYLFGTMHSQDQLVTRFPPEVRLALAQSQLFIIESVLSEESNKVFFESIFFSNNENLSGLIATPIYQYLESVLPDYGVPFEKTPHLKPWAAFTLIARPKPVNAATLDMVLIETARSLNKTVIGLETMQELIEPMEKLSLADQLIILNDTVCNHQQIIRDSWELVQLYLARDLAGMKAFSDQPHYDEAVFNRYIHAILYKRNDKMLERITPHLDQGSAFIAVGALHLAGERGLLQRLKNKNYQISRIY